MQNAEGGDFTFEDLVLGTKFCKRYIINQDVYQRFLALFGDASPLHISDDLATSCGFSSKLMHGAILNGFISNLVGMHFPGRRALLLGVEIRFLKPAYLGDALDLEATVRERLESRGVVVLHFNFSREREAIARGRVSVKICDF